jgi:hypothetical protein
VLAAQILGGWRVGIRIGDSVSQMPRPWRTGLVALILAMPVISLIPIASAVTALATTGRLMRWLAESRDRICLRAGGAPPDGRLHGRPNR